MGLHLPAIRDQKFSILVCMLQILSCVQRCIHWWVLTQKHSIASGTEDNLPGTSRSLLDHIGISLLVFYQTWKCKINANAVNITPWISCEKKIWFLFGDLLIITWKNTLLYLGLRDSSSSVIFFAITKLCSNLQCLYFFLCTKLPSNCDPRANIL